ncbi:MAG: patatin-like phospholipase family protein, partial [Duncaniella sp.]|nr:patatin-like phospholipase family protein [Duncaniella sp.]
MLDMLRFSRKPYKLGIVLSGGGARGFAHAGALQAFEEMGIKPDIIGGVSAGSVVTVMYASGMKPLEIVKVFSDAKFGDFAELAVPKDGFFSMDGFKKFLRRHVPYADIADLPIPSVVCATDLMATRPVAFTRGDMAECVSASCSIPIVFKPVTIDGTVYVDGGVTANLPAWALRDKCKYLIGGNCSPMPRRGKP